MSFSVIDAPQRSPEWFAARLGRLTGSRAMKMLATRKDGKPSSERQNVKLALVLERLTGKSQDSGGYMSDAMQDGIDREGDAFAEYEALTGTVLMRSGFLSHVEYMAGCSLDGHVLDYEGIAEIKCPIPATHWEYLRTGKVPGDYLRQVTHNLWITDARWCDWFSFNPDFPEALRMKVVRVTRADVDLGDYEKKALAFLAEVDLEVASARGLDALKAGA